MSRSYFPTEYWSGVAARYGRSDDGALAPILHPDAPIWFNLTVDRLQKKLWQRALRACALPANAKILDIGCGTGRWIRRYSEAGFNPVGIDATQHMLQRANEIGTHSPLIVAPAQNLPFKDRTFDLISSVTVVQHVIPADQPKILREMARVLRPGGHLLLLELISGAGPHIFPRSPTDWRKLAEDAGLKLETFRGQEFLLPDRIFTGGIQFVRRVLTGATPSVLPAQSRSVSRPSLRRRIYWSARHLTCKLSEWVEPAAEAVCPNNWATHGLFLFRK
ncbi:MAG TPA: methyltransferase domain-containing protein [Candidatus Acidoferrales bacterium]|nr:methyltransferase domain-containing protein [Candidatus Acidoferrales bacterium]